MFKRLLAVGALVASTLIVPWTITTQSANATTAPCVASAIHTGVSPQTAERRCEWRWHHGKKCKWCKQHGHWEKQWCKKSDHHDDNWDD